MKASNDFLVRFKEFEIKRQAADRDISKFRMSKSMELREGYTSSDINEFCMLSDIILLHNGITPNAVMSTIIGSIMTPGFIFIFLETHLVRFIFITLASLAFLVGGIASIITGKMITRRYKKLI